jgi:transposase InsO family protein
MCRVLDASTSGYFEWKKRTCSKRVQRRAMLKEEVANEFAKSKQRYGYRKVAAALLRRNIEVSEGTVRSIMKELGLAPKRRRKYRCTTNSKHKLPVAPNLLERNFDPERINQVWVGDITEIQTKEGSLYFAGVKDLCSKRLIGWSLQDHMKADLVVTALKNALMNRRDIKDLIFHSDRGVQYASVEFR